MQRGSLNQQYIGAIGNQLAQLFAPPDNSKKMQYMLQGSQIAENDSQVRYNDAGTSLRTQEWGRREEIANTDPNDPKFFNLGQSLATGASDFQGGVAKAFDTNVRQAANKAFTTGDYTGGNRQMMSVANGPTQVVSDIGGYFGNAYDTGTALRASGKTTAQIGASNAQAASSYASANNSNASAAKTRDEMANPGKYRAPGSGGAGAGASSEMKYTDIKGIDSLIDFYIPGNIEFSKETRNRVLNTARQKIAAREAAGAKRNDDADVAEAVDMELKAAHHLNSSVTPTGLAAAFAIPTPPVPARGAAPTGLSPEEQAELEELRRSLLGKK